MTLISEASSFLEFLFHSLAVLEIQNSDLWQQFDANFLSTFFTFSHQYSLKFSIQMNKTAYLNNFQYLQRIIKLYFLMAFLPFTHPLHCHCSSSNFLFPHLIPCIFYTLFPASAFFFSNLLFFLSHFFI